MKQRDLRGSEGSWALPGSSVSLELQAGSCPGDIVCRLRAGAEENLLAVRERDPWSQGVSTLSQGGFKWRQAESPQCTPMPLEEGLLGIWVHGS